MCSFDLLLLKTILRNGRAQFKVNRNWELNATESNFPPNNKLEVEDTHLVWMDDKFQLLLETTKDLKAEQAYAGVNWESKKQKHEKNSETYALAFPPWIISSLLLRT